MEMKYIFREEIRSSYFFSEIDIDPSRSPYIKQRISILYSGPSFEQLLIWMQEHKNEFKKNRLVHCKFSDAEIDYDDWMDASRLVYCEINGTKDSCYSDNLITFTKVDGLWIFGTYTKNSNDWKYHDEKPHSNSHSLGIRTARALVNLAIDDDFNRTLIDPCCGVGTIIIEAVSLGMSIKAYEINESVCKKANENLAFYGIDELVVNADMNDCVDHFNTAIIDIPYGLFTPVTAEEQHSIIKTARRIADRLVLISFENMDDVLARFGFTVIDRTEVRKGKFARYIRVCR